VGDFLPALDLLRCARCRADVLRGRAHQLALLLLLQDAADQPAVRAAVNIAGIMCGGTWAKSRITAAQNSTFVSIARSVRRSRSTVSAACSSDAAAA
jgi:hypothetical protein